MACNSSGVCHVHPVYMSRSHLDGSYLVLDAWKIRNPKVVIHCHQHLVTPLLLRGDI